MQRQGGRYRELVAWQKAYALALTVYKLTASFPNEERFGSTRLLWRAAVSVPSNIAEGWGRGSTTDYVRFVGIARGSLHEVQTQLWIAADLNYVPDDHQIHKDIEEIERLINGLIRSLREKANEKC